MCELNLPVVDNWTYILAYPACILSMWHMNPQAFECVFKSGKFLLCHKSGIMWMLKKIIYFCGDATRF